MKNYIAQFALIVGGMLDGTRANAQAPDSADISLRIPPQIGEFQMARRRDFPDKSVMLRFMRSDSLYGDVFVYDGPDFTPSCDSSCAEGVLKAEGDDFIAAFPEFLRRKYVDTINVTTDQPLIPPANASWRIGRHVRMWQMKDGKTQWSDLYLYYLRGFRVKVRATYPADSATAVTMREFATAAPLAFISTRNLAAAPAGGLDDDTKPIVVSVTLPGTPSTTLPKLLELVRRFGYTVEDSSFRAGRLVTAPRYAWPSGAEKESWHGTESPGMRLVLNYSAKGDSTAIQIGGQSPTRPDWTDAKVARTLHMLSVLEFAAGLPAAKTDSHGRKN
jgi:hypothetical protein